MVQTPKYDNDTVNLGYLNKRLGETEEHINNNNNSITQIPKNYSTPPNPPYYKDSLLCYGNKIYRCNVNKIKGIFSWTDWSIVATDDTTVSDFINNTYEVEKLEIQEQIDGKIQTYYQENDPAIDWKTDLEKSKHIGDYWYNTNDNTQWRYNRVTTTTPITYAWGQVNVPKAVFDAIDTKKSIYTAKPTSYKKDDLWIIEESISDNDLPIGTDENPIAKGDWVFSIVDSEIYNKEHWVKRDEDISLSYLEQHYYTIGDINTNFEEIERNTDSKITKAKDEINLNVSQTYTTKTEHTAAVNDFNEQIGTINQTITEHKETISNLSVEVGEVSASVESIHTRTEEVSSNVDGIIKEINPTSTASGTSIIIEDASENSLTYLEIEGKSEQETRSGKNLLNLPSVYELTGVKENVPLTIESGSYILSASNIQNDANSSASIIFFYEDGTTHNTLYIGGDSSLIRNLNFTKKVVKYNIYSGSSWVDSQGITTIFKNLMISVNGGEYEEYGVSPSPDYPSEIQSVGYENLFDKNNYNNIKGYFMTGEIIGQDLNDILYIPCTPKTTYTVSKNKGSRFEVAYTTELPAIGVTTIGGNTSTWENESITITTGADAKYLVMWVRNGNVSTEITLEDVLNSLIITKGTKKHSYVPYGKYGIEVETVGKNIFNSRYVGDFYNADMVEKNGITATMISDGVVHLKGTATKDTYFNFYVGKDSSQSLVEYRESVVSYDSCGGNFIFGYFKEDGTPVNKLNSGSIIPNDAYSMRSYLLIGANVTIDKICYLQLEIGNSVTKYKPYQKNTSLIVLNAPLRSLPNGVADKVYIKNNRLYVDRYVGSVILNGSEEWNYYTITTGAYQHYLIISNLKHHSDEASALSNYFISDYIDNRFNKNDIVYTYSSGIAFRDDRFSNTEDWKTWLSTHNTEVYYELETPITEELGEIEMPSTFKGYNNITTTDDLEPTINLTYVRDTVVADYVEQHVAELKINEDQIKQSVETINSSVDGLSTDISRVEQITTDNSQILNIISTNIDKTTGDVREVTTTTGFTFNAEGMTIQDSEGYQASHSTKGTVYKDGDTITGQYTKDGSKQKDLELFGTYSYGKENIDDTPMFVGELYTDENGEECFGHFYNGGDY